MHAQPPETEGVIEHEVRVAASPETVFGYFTDPAKIVRWMGSEAILDPRPGGVCRLGMAGLAVMSGRFVEVNSPSRIVFTWGWETELFDTPPQSTLVEVDLTAAGEETVVHLVHRRLAPGAAGPHRVGWRHYLPRLALAASGRDAGVDPWHKPDAVLHELRNAGLVPPDANAQASQP
jgi:uncharacterized protein YndB with AHSA1/START domain